MTRSRLQDPKLTGGRTIYAELRGHPNDFHEDKDEVGYSPLLWGLSYENVVPQVLGLSALDASPHGPDPAALAALGLDVAQLDSTWASVRRAASFQWYVKVSAVSSLFWLLELGRAWAYVGAGCCLLLSTLQFGRYRADLTFLRPFSAFRVAHPVEHSAFVSLTHVNASGWIDPPPQLHHNGSAPTPPPQTPCDATHWLKGADALKLGSGDDLCHPAVEAAAGWPEGHAAATGVDGAGGVGGGNGGLEDGCKAVSTAAGCCAYCGSLGPACGAWFFNGDPKAGTCGGHGCCYAKRAGSPDRVTPPNPLYVAGYGPAEPAGDDWCEYTGSYQAAPSCPAPGGKTCACPSFAVIGKMLGWELGWAAYRRDWARLIVLHRWLGSAAHVEQTALFGESYVYDCIKNGEEHGFAPPVSNSTPRGAGCWGDPGNGVQIGWFVWGEALARSVAGLPTAR